MLYVSGSIYENANQITLYFVEYTASKNYMQIVFFVILYRFLNQCFGNLAPGIVTFVSAYMQNFMPISATINKR